MYYDLLSPTPPPLPRKLPGFISHTISRVPNYVRSAAAQMLFPPVVAQLHDIEFRYLTNKLHEPVCCMEGCVADSGVGKGFLDDMIEEIIRPLREHDRESDRKLEEWSSACNTKSSNQEKPDRPKDASTLCPESDFTNPALIIIAKDAEREGNRSFYTLMGEVDQLDQNCGSHKKVTNIIRLNYDTKIYGAHRATSNGISGRAHLRWKFNFSSTPESVRDFFKGRALTDGTLGRVGISWMAKPLERKKGDSRQGNYDADYQQKLGQYMQRLLSASGQGEVKVRGIDRLIERLWAELDAYCDLVDDKTFEGFERRSIERGWLKGCICYIAEGYRWTKEIAEFVEWSIYYDLWSKIHVFCSQMKHQGEKSLVDKRRFGPVNMLETLPNSFSKTQWEQMRQAHDKPFNDDAQLRLWQSRGFVTYSSQTGMYSKTAEYLATHPQSAK